MYSLQKSRNNIYTCTLLSHISNLFDFIFLQDFSDVDRKGIPMPITTADARPSRAPRKTHRLTPRLGVVLLPLFLAACGLPPAVTVASFAIDAISLAVSDKTVADHALSQIVQQDCSMWRGLTGDELCIDEDSAVAVAAADGPPPAGGADSAELVAIYAPAAPVSHSHVPPVRGKKAKSSRKAEAPKKPPVTISAVPAADDDAAAEADGSEIEEAPRATVPEELATSASSSVSENFLLLGA